MIAYCRRTHAARRRTAAGQGGFVLAAALVLMAIVGLLVASLVALTTSVTKVESALAERAERVRVADSALEQVTTRIGKNYLGSQNPALTNSQRLDLERQEAQMGKYGQTCGDAATPGEFTFELDGRDVRVQCTGMYTPGNGNETDSCPGPDIAAGGVYCRPATSPGLLRRVNIEVLVSDPSGGNFRTMAFGRLTFNDVDPATGIRANGNIVTVEQWTLCNTQAEAAACAAAP